MSAVELTIVVSEWEPTVEQSVLDIGLGHVIDWLRESGVVADSVSVRVLR